MRPPVAVIVPFKGSRDDAKRVSDQLLGLKRGPDDELIIADNNGSDAATSGLGVTVVRADRIASSYYARNTGASFASAPWLLFVDSDCILPPTLIDDFGLDDVPDDCGIVAGELEAAREQTEFVAAYERSRGHLEVEQHMQMGPHPAGITANLMVRRDALDALGGFVEVRSGADLEFCWRAQDAGWGLVFQPRACVEHLHTSRVRDLLRKARRYGPGQAWVNDLYPGSSPPPKVGRSLTRAVAGAVAFPLLLQPRRGAYKALDGLWIASYAFGYRRGDNRAGPIGSSGS